MAFRCPQCHTRDSLEIIASMEFPPDRRSGEIALQVVGCAVCPFRGLAVYAEARGGYSERDDFEHTGYWVSPDAVDKVLAAIQSCPDPHQPQCKCPAHTRLGEKDVYGMWSGLLEMKQGHTFSMRMSMG